ncbi:MAG: hypothetical protein IT445_12160 [Phycisphaeraceae bacterium]|nr:hypothetical protein [Phycisphaeraceae bacterium]
MKDPRYRVACLIHEHLLAAQNRRRGDQVRTANSIADELQRFQRAQRLASLAYIHNFQGALRRLDQQMDHLLLDVKYHVESASRLFAHESRTVLTAHELLDELDQIDAEFEARPVRQYQAPHFRAFRGRDNFRGRGLGWRFEAEERTLSVWTEPIELEGLYLGTFEIKLFLAEIGLTARRLPFRCIALDPHSPAGNEHITHPHVSDDYLCTGEADAALNASLGVGRLADFFLMVRQILRTYNPESPYVAIEHWEAELCPDCGYAMCEDEQYFCEQCERYYCDSCMSGCNCCQSSFCRGCLHQCEFCDESVCKECMLSCAKCGIACCQSCLDDDLCPNCKEEQEQQDGDDEDNPNEGEERNTSKEQPQAA